MSKSSLSKNPLFQKNKRLKLNQLEQRVLYDAELAADLIESSDKTLEVSLEMNLLVDNLSSSTESQSEKVVFIDSAILNKEAFIDVAKNYSTVIILDNEKNPWKQISEEISNLSNIKEIHLVSHGSQEGIILNNTIYNLNNISEYSSYLESIGMNTKDGGDFLIYGCNIGSTQKVDDFSKALKNYTGLDIALSVNDTGSVDGADFNLEYNYGSIEATTFKPINYSFTLSGTNDGFGDIDYNGDGTADPLRMITWNVIGLDSNKPETSGPENFMVGLRVNTDNQSMVNYTVKLVDDDGVDVFGDGIIFADASVPTTDFDDGVDNIRFVNNTVYNNVNIDANSYKDFYFNANVQRLLSSIGQMQPFHFEVFQDANGDGIFNDGEAGQKLTKFSWLPDAAASNTPLYLYVEHLISQARNDITNETYPTQTTSDDTYAAIRVDGYTTNGNYPEGPITIFVGQELNIRVEGETATQGYPQLTVSTYFNNSVFSTDTVSQAYNVTSPIQDYQQGLGSGAEADSNFETLDGINDNTSTYANSAGWNPATHSLMITSAPPKAGGGPIVTDYNLTVTGTGSGKLETIIQDYSGSSFHYNADLNNGVEGIDFVRYQAVKGTIVGQVLADTDGDGIGDSPLAGVTVSLNGTLDANLNGQIDVGETITISNITVTTDANGYYVFTDLLPGVYTVNEGSISGYGDVNDTDGGNKNQVTVVIGKDVTVGSVASLGLAGVTAYKSQTSTEILSADQVLGYQRADFIEGRPDLALTKTASTLTPSPGGQVTYTLTITNSGSASAPYIEVTDQLPVGVSFVSSSGDGVYDAGTGLWVLSSGLEKGQTATIDIVCTLSSTDKITNFAQVSAIKSSVGGTDIEDQDSVVNNNDGTRVSLEDDEAKVTVEAQEADLALIKTYSNFTVPGDRPSVGDVLEFKIIVTNSGPNDATNVVMTDRLPSTLGSITLISATAGTFNTTTGVWEIPSVANGETAVLIYRGTLTAANEFSNFAQITSADQYDPDSVHGNDTDSTTNEDDEGKVIITPHASDLSLNKVVNTLAPDIGENITYTLILTNSGPDAATNVVVKDLLPAGLTFVSYGGTGSYDDSTGLWSVGTVNVGETVTIQIVATVTSSNTISNFAQVYSSDLPDSDSIANNDLDGTPNEDDESGVTITPGATDLSLSKTYSVDDGVMSSIGDIVTFTLKVTNSGAKDAYNVRIKDLLESGFTFQSAAYGGIGYLGDGSYNGVTGIWNVGTLGAGETATISFKAAVNTLFEKQNYAEIIEADALITDTAGDGNSTLSDVDSNFNNDSGAKTANEDDEALIKIAPIPYADLQLTNVISKVNPVENENITFTLTVTNTGFGDATGVAVSYVFPQNTGAAGQFADPSSFAFSDGTDTNTYSTTTGAGTWTIGNLAYGETTTLTITVKTPTGSGGDKFSTDLSLFAQISSSSLPDTDSTVANNKGTDTTLGTSDDGSRTPYEDDEALATAISPTSTRLDVALTENISVTRSAMPISNADALVLGDQVTVVVTGYNQGGDANSAYIVVKWDAGIDLSTVTMASSTATNQTTAEYATDASGTTWSSTKPTNPTYIRFKIDTSSSATKFDSGSTATVTLVGTINASGVGQNATVSSWFADIGSGSDVDSDSSVSGVINGESSNDLATDDLSDGVVDDDEAKLTIGGNQSSDLSVTKAISLDGAQTWFNSVKMYDGDTGTLRITVTNNGPDVASNVTIDNQLPTGTVYKTYYGYGSYASGTWNVGTLAVGQTASIYILVDVDWDATVATTLNSKSEIITVDQPDTDSTKNNGITTEDDYGSITITKDSLNKADLSLTKSIDNNSPKYGENVTFTLTVNNAGPASATGVIVKDLLPTGLTFISYGGDGTYDDSTGLWTVGSSIANGSSATIQIVAKVETISATSNFAQIYASDLPDPDSTTNNDTNNTDNEDDEAKANFTPVASDLSLTKIVNNATPNVGDTVTFTLSVVNAGPSIANGVLVKDLIDQNILSSLNISSPTGDNNYTVATGIWDIGTIQVGEVVKLQISGTLISAASFYNFAEVIASDNTDPDSVINNDNGDQTTNEDDEGKVFVKPLANDLELYKSFKNLTDPSGPLDVGDTVEFTLTLINAGGVGATNVQITDYLPSNLILDNLTLIGSTLDGSSVGTFNTTTGLWDLSSSIINEGSIAVLKYTATVKTPDTFNVFAEITSSDQYDIDSTVNNDLGAKTASEDEEAIVTLDARSADLSLIKSVSKQNPQIGETITFSIDVINSSNDDATGVSVVDYITSDFAFVTGSANFSGVYVDNLGTDTLTWSNLTIAGNSKVTLTFRGIALSGTVATNTAEITASDVYDPDSNPNDGSGDDFSSVNVDAKSADLSLTKSVAVSNKTQADIDGYYTATYTITITNDGPDSANFVQVKDGLPKGIGFISSSSTVGSYNPNNGIWDLPTLANGETATLTITTKVLVASSLQNKAEVVASDTKDPDSVPNNFSGSEDDEGSANVDVEMIDLSLMKTVSPSAPTLGGPISYTLTLSNGVNFDNATGVKVTDSLPAGFVFGSYVASAGTFDNITGIWDVGTVAAGQVFTLTLNGTVGSLSDLVNIAEVTSANEFDVDSKPNDGTDGQDDYAKAVPESLSLITGKVLDDKFGAKADGFDVLDKPIANVTVKLFNQGDDPLVATPVAETTTDVNGVYSFYVGAGNYFIYEVDPSSLLSVASLQSTDPLSGNQTLDTSNPGFNTKTINVVASAEYYENNFLDLTPFQVSGNVYLDSDNDAAAIGDADDNGLSNAQVALYRATNAGTDGIWGTNDDVYVQERAYITVNNDGSYNFDSLSAGRYKVVEVNPFGYSDVTDSDGDTNGKNSIEFVLNGNTGSKTDANFLDALTPGSIVGRVVFDADADDAGFLDADDTPLSGVTLKLFNQGDDPLTATPVDTTTTDADGNFSFSSVSPGNYFVYEVNPSGKSSVADTDGSNDDKISVNLTVGQSAANLGFVDKLAPNSPPTVNVVDGNGANSGHETVVENSSISSKTFSVTTTNTIAKITIEGTDISYADLLTASTTNVNINTTKGVLTITGYNDTTKEITYSYDPNGTNKDHSGGEITDDIALGVTDGNGLTGSATLTILITDTTPTAIDDSNSITEDDSPNTVSSSVFTGAGADLTGSDTPINVVGVASGNTSNYLNNNLTVGANVNGTYGSVVINSDGSYTYTLDNTNSSVQALNNGDTLTDIFTYSIIDSDGSTSFATLTINIDGSTDSLSVDITDNNGAASGDETVVEDSTLTSKTFSINSTDAIDKLTIQGTDVSYADLVNSSTTNVVVTTTEGTLTIIGYNPTTKEITYSYDPLGTNKDHSGGEVTDPISITLTDVNGLTNTNTLTILITDTTPTAIDDTNSITEDAAPSNLDDSVFSGVGADLTGSDTPIGVVGVAAGNTGVYSNSVSTVGSSVTGSYGSVVINSDGSYTYTLDNTNGSVQALNTGDTLTDIFTYSIIDSDGSTSFAKLTITINGVDDNIGITVSDGNGSSTGNESVPENSNISGKHFSIIGNNAISKITVSGTDVLYSDLLNVGTTNIVINTTKGVLTITGYDPLTKEVTYSYDPLGTNKDHSGGEVVDNISLSVTDEYNFTANGNLNILITDTVPTAINDTNSITEDSYPSSVSSSVFNGVGADLTGSDTPISVVGVSAGNTGSYLDNNGTIGSSISGSYGSVVINADGSYTYTLDNTNISVQGLNTGDTLTDTFTYSITDSDGSTSFATLTITINGANEPYADLVTTKQLYSESKDYQKGDIVSFIVQVKNLGNTNTTGVNLIENIPDGLSLVSAYTTEGSFVGNVWNIGNLSVNQMATLILNFEVTVDQDTQIVNTVSAATSDINDPSNNGNDLDEGINVKQIIVVLEEPKSITPIEGIIENVTEPINKPNENIYFDPSLHVLNTVNDVRNEAIGVNYLFNKPLSSGYDLTNWDPALYVIPTVDNVAQDAAILAGRINDFSSNISSQIDMKDQYSPLRSGLIKALNIEAQSLKELEIRANEEELQNREIYKENSEKNQDIELTKVNFEEDYERTVGGFANQFNKLRDFT